MKKNLTILVALICMMSAGSIEAQTWEQLNIPTAQNLNDLYFHDLQSGWVAGDQGVFKTTDGGSTWTIFPTNEDVNGIYFINNLEGWACGNDGFLIHTTNGGMTWMSQNSGAFDKLRDVYMVDASTGWIAGRDGILRKTTNGGVTWLHQNNPAFDDLHKIAAFDNNTAWVVGQDGFILHTVNGGINWMSQQSGTNETIESVSFIDAQNGWVGGSLGFVKNTTNAGTNWVSQPSDATGSVNDILFLDLNNGWFVTQNGEIFKTMNGGISWMMSDDFFSAQFAVHFVNPAQGYTVGANGFIAKYNAVTGFEEDLADLPFQFSLNQNYPNPFNASTIIGFELKNETRVTLEIYDILGNKIITLVNENRPTGHHQVVWDAEKQSTGVYYYRIQASDYTETRKMLLVK